jgi:hypothetical protein
MGPVSGAVSRGLETVYHSIQLAGCSDCRKDLIRKQIVGWIAVSKEVETLQSEDNQRTLCRTDFV